MSGAHCPTCGEPQGSSHLYSDCAAIPRQWRHIVCGALKCGEPAQPEHTPCCSSTFHNKSLCCEHYRRAHFVEVNKCSPAQHATGGTP